MGFDILIWGVLLLLCPIPEITDIAAAVILIAAYRKSGKYLPEMLSAGRFSCGFLALGALEMIFGCIFPMEIIFSALSLARTALLLAILVYTARGLMSLAMIAENAILHDRAAGLIVPIYVICAIKALGLVAVGFFPRLSLLLIFTGLCEAGLILMIFLTVLKFYQNINVYPAAAAAEDEELS